MKTYGSKREESPHYIGGVEDSYLNRVMTRLTRVRFSLLTVFKIFTQFTKSLNYQIYSLHGNDHFINIYVIKK